MELRNVLALTLVAGTAFAGCSEPTATNPAPTGARFALVAINNVPLPTRPAGFTYTVIADTLQFGATSSRWKPTPLAVAMRHVIDITNAPRVDEWWFTYDSLEPLPSPFAMRILCADGDQNSLADCLNGNGQATLDAGGLTITFQEPVFGVLKYQRVP